MKEEYLAGEYTDVQEESRTKVCPRCGAVLFADMDVCYGCLFDFTRDLNAHEIPGMPPVVALPEQDNPAMETKQSAQLTVQPKETSKQEPSSDLDTTTTLGAHLSGGESVAVRVSLPDLSVVVPLSSKGLFVGREETNDIVLRSKTVSRRHLYISPADQGVVLEDLGATNPALVYGEPLENSLRVQVGTSMDVCGAQLTLVRI